MEQPQPHDIIRFGISTLVKLVLFFFVVLIIISVFLVTIGWILTMAFSEFKLFEATIIPLLVLGFTTILVGLISIWIRLGEIVYVIDPDNIEFTEDDLESDDYYYDDDDVKASEISSLKRPTKVTPIYKNRMRNSSKTENNDVSKE